MKTIVAASIGMALAAVGASTALAQVPAQDSVTGSFTTGNDRAEFVFTFDVRSGPSGESSTGTVGVYSIGAGDLGTFAVSCRASVATARPWSRHCWLVRQGRPQS